MRLFRVTLKVKKTLKNNYITAIHFACKNTSFIGY